jgi:pimeloyl-ACP methyl ester carboxylesterase
MQTMASTQPHLRLILLPGLGADERLFAPQRQAFPDLFVPPWLHPHKNETLAHYARRMAHSIDNDQPCILGGVSLGGMVALEMAKYLRPKATVLIGSCRSRDELRPGLRLLEAVLSRTTPHWVVGAMRKPSAPLLYAGRHHQHQRLLTDMLLVTSPKFLKRTCRAILTWKGPDQLPTLVRQIHGERDMIMPVKKTQADRVIPAADHLINLTHADEVNRFLAETMHIVTAQAPAPTPQQNCLVNAS